MSLGLAFIYGCVAVAAGLIGAVMSSSYIFSFPVNRILGWLSLITMAGGIATAIISGLIWLVLL